MAVKFWAIFVLWIFMPAAYAQARTEDLEKQIQSEIFVQLDYLKAATNLRGEKGIEERRLRARAIAELFFDKRLRTYQSRELVFETSQKLIEKLRRFLEGNPSSPERREAVFILEQELLNVYDEVSQLPEFSDSKWKMRRRALFSGFVISPGVVYGTYILGDLLILVGKLGDTAIYVLPRELIDGGRQFFRWSQLGWAHFRGNSDLAEKCRQKIKDISKLRSSRVASLRRDGARWMQSWQKYLGPHRVTAYLTLGAGLSYIFYNFPVPILNPQNLSYEDQHDWDAQEDALLKILGPFFAEIK